MGRMPALPQGRRAPQGERSGEASATSVPQCSVHGCNHAFVNRFILLPKFSLAPVEVDCHKLYSASGSGSTRVRIPQPPSPPGLLGPDPGRSYPRTTNRLARRAVPPVRAENHTRIMKNCRLPRRYCRARQRTQARELSIRRDRICRSGSSLRVTGSDSADQKFSEIFINSSMSMMRR